MTKTTLTTTFKQTRSIWIFLFWSLTLGTVAFAQPPQTAPATTPLTAPATQPAAPAAQSAPQPAAQTPPKPTITTQPTTTTQPLPAGSTVPPIYLPAEPVVRKRPVPRRVDTAARAALPTALPAAAPALGLGIDTTRAAAARVDTPKIADPTVPVLSQSDNPFDILRGATTKDSTAKANAAKGTSAMPGSDPIMFIFWVMLFISLLLAFVSITSRHVITQVYRSLANDSSLRLVYKGNSGWGNFAYITLYFICWMNLAVFAYLMMHRYKGGFGYSPWLTFLICLGGVILFFTVKHFFLYILSTIFPLEKEIKLYNFIVMSAGILIGLALTPLNIFMAFTAPALSSTFMYLAIAAIFVVFVLRALRGLFVGATYLSTHPFHFLLYLCTAEIAPLAVLAKLVLLKSGI
jgi:hypothetical protein